MVILQSGQKQGGPRMLAHEAHCRGIQNPAPVPARPHRCSGECGARNCLPFARLDSLDDMDQGHRANINGYPRVWCDT